MKRYLLLDEPRLLRETDRLLPGIYTRGVPGSERIFVLSVSEHTIIWSWLFHSEPHSTWHTAPVVDDRVTDLLSTSTWMLEGAFVDIEIREV